VQKQLCPGQKIMGCYARDRAASRIRHRIGLPDAPVACLQVHEIHMKKSGVKLSIATIFPLGTPLSAPIYKIRTLLSTGFVDNGSGLGGRTPREALSGAGFGTVRPR
jgi:hypothetical protein